MDKIGLSVADAKPIFRNGIREVLKSHPALQILFETSSGLRLIKQLGKKKVKIILFGNELRDLNTSDVIRIIHYQFPEIKKILIDKVKTRRKVKQMVEIGVCGYLKQNITPGGIVQAIKDVHETGFHFNEHLSEPLLSEVLLKQDKKKLYPSIPLTTREIEVLSLICDEKQTPEIAEILNLSEKTIERHRERLLFKTRSKNMAGLVKYAIAREIVVVRSE